jgi:quercetin dioxygenase-like cupin family protein
MKSKVMWTLVIAMLGVVSYGASSVLATPPSGTTFTLLAPVAQFGEIDADARSGDWTAKIKTKGLSDLHLTEVTIQPGGNGGWHSHPGPSFVTVKSGTATAYEGPSEPQAGRRVSRARDTTCTPLVLQTGSGLFEPAGDVHIVRNEGSEPLVLVVIQLLPSGAPRRIDEPAPGNCPF